MKRNSAATIAAAINFFNAGSFEVLAVREHDAVSLFLCVVSLLLGVAFAAPKAERVA